MIQKISGDVQNTIKHYFESSNEGQRKENWIKLMDYFQFHMHNPRDIRFRIIKNRTQDYPILIFKNIKNDSKLLIPLIPDRIIKLNFSDFINTGVTADILTHLTYDNRMYKVYNDLIENKKPLLFENTAS